MASHAIHRSLPNRSPSNRPRALSLSEYQPLAFDRDAVQAAYQTQLTLPSVSSAYTRTNTGTHTASSGLVTGTNSSSTVPTTVTAGTDSSKGGGSGGYKTSIPPSTVSSAQHMQGAGHYIGDAELQAPVPVWATDEEMARRAGSGNMTGIGAGHSLTPPGSPLHRAARARASSLSQSQDGSDQSHPAQAQAPVEAHALSPIPASPAVFSPVTGKGFVYPTHPPPNVRRPSGLGINAEAEPSGAGARAGAGGLERRFGRMGVDEAFDVPPISSPKPVGAGVMGNTVYAYNPIGSDGQLVTSSPALAQGTGPPLPLPARPPIAGASNGTGLFNSRNTGRTGRSGQAEDDGWDSDPGFPRYVGGNRGGRRALPAVPANMPAPAPPAWEPDYKPQIPASLTQPSVDDAYAQLSAPPPGIVPRVRPNAQNYASGSGAGPSNTAHSAQPTPADISIPLNSPSYFTGHPSTTGQQANLDPSSPIATMDPIQITTQRPPRPRLPRPAEDRVHLRADGRTPIWSTHYIDPSLRNTVVSVPAQLSNLGNIALSGLAGGEKQGWNSTTGAPVDGMARLAKEWFLTPDGRFTADKGPIELGIGVVDAGETGWGREKGRKRARVEVVNKAGGIKVEVIEIDDDRQLDMRIEAKTGDILVLLPEDYFGTIHVSSPVSPHFCRLVSYNKARTAHPNDVFWSTFVVPPDISILANAHGSVTDSEPSVAELTPRERKARAARPIEHKSTLGTSKYMPDFMRGQDPMMDQIIAAYAAHTRGEWSKIHVSNMGNKGRVVFGYRESEDEGEIKEMGLRVGVEHEKRKRWWMR